jgi:hypothetical protein
MMWQMDAFHHATPAQPLLLADPPPRLLVDLSNVCRERALGAGDRRAAWERFVRVMHAWQRQLGGVPRGLALADENLRFLLCERDRVALEAAERDGIVRSVPGSADREILRLAERHGACVLSSDYFRGSRRDRHPWIQGCVDRFFAWKLDADGELTIVARDMGHTSAPSLSRHAELDELRDRGLDARLPADRELLGHGYRCTNEACLTARWHPDRLLVLPEQRDGRPRCPGCGCPLADLGPRPATVKVVIERRDGAKLLERTLEEGQELQLGRADLLDADDPRLPRVSRRHVQLSLRDGRLWARDLDSRNGTTLIRWDERHAAGAPAVALAGEPLALGPRDLLVLAGAVRLRRSGERFAIAAPAAEDPRRATGATTTDEGVREAR